MLSKELRNLTLRRYYLDNRLAKCNYYGQVLDIGGKKINKRGLFHPPTNNVESWQYVNIDMSTNPDYLCPADAIDVQDMSFDIVILTEVLEHLENPEKVLQEAYRILKKHGKIIISMPFLYPIHGDPDDFQRWTPSKIKQVLRQNNFLIDSLEPMGGLFSVYYDLLRTATGMASKNRKAIKNRILMKFIFPFLAQLAKKLDRHFEYKMFWITTGYFVVGIKSE